MTDTTLNRYLAQGTRAQRLAFTPDPGIPASGPDPSVEWYETDTGDDYVWNFQSSDWVQVGNAGTVTSVSVSTANGVSGSVATATTTPAISLTLGAITPTSVNGNTITTGTGTLTLGANTLTVAGTASVNGTNTGDQTTVSGNAGTATALATARAIYGNNFDGTAALTQVIASTYGGTGNGFTKFTGPTTSEKIFTLPDASKTLMATDTAVAAGQMPALTGDITTSAGAVATTLATVNSNVGSYTNANITVNAKGLVTAAANGSGGASGMVQHAQVICAGSQATIVFSSLPTDGSYTNLEIWLTARDVVNSAQVSMFLKMNSDATAANYTTAQLGQTSGNSASNAGVSSTTSGMFIGNLAGVNGNANAVGSYRISVPGYFNTTFHKPVFVHFEELDSAGPTQRAGYIGATWLATTAISTLTITTAGTNFVNGSIATCYLLK